MKLTEFNKNKENKAKIYAKIQLTGNLQLEGWTYENIDSHMIWIPILITKKMIPVITNKKFIELNKDQLIHMNRDHIIIIEPTHLKDKPEKEKGDD